jgi:hypothetical protein
MQDACCLHRGGKVHRDFILGVPEGALELLAVR